MPQTKERWNTAQQNEKMKKPKSSGRFHFCVDFGETKKKELTVKERDGMKKKKREKEEKKKDVNRKRANRRMKEHRAAKVKKERERNEEYYRKKRMQKNGKKMDECLFICPSNDKNLHFVVAGITTIIVCDGPTKMQ